MNDKLHCPICRHPINQQQVENKLFAELLLDGVGHAAIFLLCVQAVGWLFSR
jgi:hypothetical protein